MDVAEMARGNGYVLRRYLDAAVYLGPLAVQARPCPGGDIIGEAFPYIPGVDEAAFPGRRRACKCSKTC
jgi:hypothetical protein